MNLVWQSTELSILAAAICIVSLPLRSQEPATEKSALFVTSQLPWYLRNSVGGPSSGVKLYPFEVYEVKRKQQVQDPRTKLTSTWFELAIPLLGSRWVTTSTTDYAVKPIASLYDPSLHVHLSAAADGTTIVLDVRLSGVPPSSVYPIDIYVLSGGGEPIKLAGLAGGAVMQKVRYPSHAQSGERVVFLLVGNGTLSSRQEVLLGHIEPSVVAEPQTKRISSVVTGRQRVEMRVKCLTKATLRLPPELPELLSFESSNSPRCEGRATLHLTFDPEEWRRTPGRLKVQVGKLRYETDEGEHGETSLQLQIEEQWMLGDWLTHLALPWFLLIVAALAVGGATSNVLRDVAVRLGRLRQGGTGSVWSNRRLFRGSSVVLSGPYADKPGTEVEDGYRGAKGRAGPEILAGALQEILAGLSRIEGGLDSLRGLPNVMAGFRADLSRTFDAVDSMGAKVSVVANLLGPLTDNPRQYWLNYLKKVNTSLESVDNGLREMNGELTAALRRQDESLRVLRESMDTMYQFQQSRQEEIQSQVKALQAELHSTERARDLYQGYLVFGRSDGLRVALERLIENLTNFHRSEIQLKRTFEDLSAGLLGRFPVVRSLSRAYAGSFSNTLLRNYIGQLRLFLQEGVSALPELVRTARRGSEISAEETEERITEIIYSNCISRSWDLLLIGVQTFISLDKLVSLDTSDRDLHLRATTLIQRHLGDATAALGELNITPLDIAFLSEVDAALAPYVQCELAQCSVEAYYPLLPRETTGRRDTILDCKKWAYLKRDGKLWSNERAEIVVSG